VTCLTEEVANQLDELTLEDTPHAVFYQLVKAAVSSSKQQVQWVLDGDGSWSEKTRHALQRERERERKSEKD